MFRMVCIVRRRRAYVRNVGLRAETHRRGRCDTGIKQQSTGVCRYSHLHLCGVSFGGAVDWGRAFEHAFVFPCWADLYGFWSQLSEPFRFVGLARPRVYDCRQLGCGGDALCWIGTARLVAQTDFLARYCHRGLLDLVSGTQMSVGCRT